MTPVSNDPSWWPVRGKPVVLRRWLNWSGGSTGLMTIQYLGVCSSSITIGSSDRIQFTFRYSCGQMHCNCHAGRKMLVFLIVIFLAINIAFGVVAGIDLKNTSGVWIAIKQFRDSRQFGTSIFGSDSTAVVIYSGSLVIIAVLHMFILGPRLILAVRENQVAKKRHHCAAVNARKSMFNIESAERQTSHMTTVGHQQVNITASATIAISHIECWCLLCNCLSESIRKVAFIVNSGPHRVCEIVWQVLDLFTIVMMEDVIETSMMFGRPGW
ncbi:hypothetical protein BDR07DRAFT_1379048 [Suillus spraguei]|nr:hypothetical protein BDR07DRAFT_1379048 [Suillus spraguei]